MQRIYLDYAATTPVRPEVLGRDAALFQQRVSGTHLGPGWSLYSTPSDGQSSRYCGKNSGAAR